MRLPCGCGSTSWVPTRSDRWGYRLCVVGLLRRRERRPLHPTGPMAADEIAEHPAQAGAPQRPWPRAGPSTLSQRLLRGTRVNLPERLDPCPASQPRMNRTESRLCGHSPTGELDAGNPPVRFGGRGEVTSLVPASIVRGRSAGALAIVRRGSTKRPRLRRCGRARMYLLFRRLSQVNLEL